MPSTAFDHLPSAVRELAPELYDPAWSPEERADCSACVMSWTHTGEPPRRPWTFHPEGRCCTYNPRQPNYLLGRALRRKDDGTRVVLKRMRTRAGITAWGIHPPAEWTKRYAQRAPGRFGRDLSFRCPYWVGGTHACGIWHDRASVCRTWYCRHDGGKQGDQAWRMAKMLLARVEDALATFCMVVATPPPVEAPPLAWVNWFVWCAGRVDRMTPGDLDAVRTDELERMRGVTRRALHQTRDPIPDVLIPSVRRRWMLGDEVRIAGYSLYDAIRAPRSLMVFVAALDGRRTWQSALEEVNRTATPPVDEHLVHELYRVGAVRAPEPGDRRDDPDKGSWVEVTGDDSAEDPLAAWLGEHLPPGMREMIEQRQK